MSTTRTYIIADIGANFEATIEGAMEACAVAAAAGCSALKMQWTSNPQRMADRRGRATADGYAAVYAKYLAWDVDWHEQLCKYCTYLGIDYMCTVFLPEDVATVAPYVSRLKVASFEAMDPAMARAIGDVPDRYPVLVSTGMLSMSQVSRLTHLYAAVGILGDRLRLLHCTSCYPAPHEALGLAVLRMRGGWLAGLSDHSHPAHTWTGALAVAAGAEILEAHLRIDRTRDDNPDAEHAMGPRQFARYVDHVRFAEECLGDGVKRMDDCESAMSAYRVTGDPS